MGLRFRNRIGLGAGFDKDGVAIRGWAALGLGFVELGTVTPRPQAGSTRPRLFRLPRDRALVNRMGFNNGGADALARRIDDASDEPLRHGMLAATAEARRIAGNRLTIVASGGIGSAADASVAITAGADLVQLWTGMIYAGPGLVGDVLRAVRD